MSRLLRPDSILTYLKPDAFRRCNSQFNLVQIRVWGFKYSKIGQANNRNHRFSLSPSYYGLLWSRIIPGPLCETFQGAEQRHSKWVVCLNDVPSVPAGLFSIKNVIKRISSSVDHSHLLVFPYWYWHHHIQTGGDCCGCTSNVGSRIGLGVWVWVKG